MFSDFWRLPNVTLCPLSVCLHFPLSNSSLSAHINWQLAATSSACVVPGRAVMETFGEAAQGRLMLSVMCVRTAIYFFLFLSFPFFFFLRASGRCATSSKCFPLLNSWPQSAAKKDRTEQGKWEGGNKTNGIGGGGGVKYWSEWA